MRLKERESLGLYLHIPFCRSKCDYCDFYSLAGHEDRMDDYQKAVLVHMKELAPRAAGCGVDTIYFGGGTPSFYGARRIEALLRTIRHRFRVERDAEITCEVNPDSVDETSLRRLRRAGVNRISMGMQSACPEELAAVHRPHTAQQTDLAVEAARRAGVKNLSLDLIYGLPGQTMDSWRETVEHALTLQPEHLSCYGLKVEEGTALARRVARGEQLADDDTQADLYLWTVERLERAGLRQYEISNFARDGFESRHNLRYWKLRPYLGIGPGAHSDFGGHRFSFLRDVDGYIKGVLNKSAILDSDEIITGHERGGEYLMLGLRTSAGIEEQEYRHCYQMDFQPLEQKLLEYESRGWACRRGERWRLTPEGFLLSNQLIGELLECQRPIRLPGKLGRQQGDA